MTPDPRRNDGHRDKVRELHKAKYSVRAIAEEIGVSPTRVQQIKTELGLRAIPRAKLARMASSRPAA